MLSFVFWFVVTITTVIVLAYRSIPLRESTIAVGVLLIIYSMWGNPAGFYLFLLWIAFALLVSLNIPEIRRNYYSPRILKLYKSTIPRHHVESKVHCRHRSGAYHTSLWGCRPALLEMLVVHQQDPYRVCRNVTLPFGGQTPRILAEI